jgi:hypothetical protein
MKSSNDFDGREKKGSAKSLGGWLFITGLLGAVFVCCSILYVWLYVQQVQNGYSMAKLHEEHEQLLAVQRKLRLEWSRFQDPFQLEEMGREQFGLAPPGQDQKVLMR